MIEKVLLTYKVLMEKALNRDFDKLWIDWAIEMIESGYLSNNLFILAGMTQPFNYFEMQDLTSRVLKDLNLEYHDKKQVIMQYINYLITKTINNSSDYLSVLDEIHDIYLDYENEDYINFDLLYFAKSDLNEAENQWYWEGANRSNIDFIIKEEFQKYLNKIENI